MKCRLWCVLNRMQLCFFLLMNATWHEMSMTIAPRFPCVLVRFLCWVFLGCEDVGDEGVERREDACHAQFLGGSLTLFPS